MPKKNFKEQFKTARESMKLMSPERIVELIKNCDEWFGYSNDPHTAALIPRILKMGKPAQIEFIMSADPIAADGGLLDFLVDQGIIEDF